MKSFIPIQFLVVLVILVKNIACKKFKDGERVHIIANKVGPYNNPTETYKYYQLPFCQPERVERRSHGLGEFMAGDRKVVSSYNLNFKENLEETVLCTKALTAPEVRLFHKAIDEEYYFEFFMDNLPIWGYVGDSPSYKDVVSDVYGFDAAVEQKKYLYTHLSFTIKHNEGHIVEWNATTSTSHRQDITEITPTGVTFTYSVEWIPTTQDPKTRMQRYQHGNFLPATFEIHWLSIINTFVLVLLLMIFLMIILMRVLKNDFTRYMADADELDDDAETGWKLIHGDVFRFPKYKILFTAMVGAGTQVLFITSCFLVLVLLSVFTPTKRGSIQSALLVLYALTAGVGGYTSANLYRQMDGGNWVWNVMICASLIPGPLFIIFSILNSIAWYYESTAALPFGTIVIIFLLNILVTFPLTVLGGMLGRKNAKLFDAPCRTMKVARMIPPGPWYQKLWSQMFIAGFLPFSAIYIELYYIFNSIWGHKYYSLFGILSLAFLLLLLVTCFITVALIYFQLAGEDHRWWWRSLAYGGSTGIFVYAYSFFYYYNRSEMSGTLQTSYFFGYMLVVSYMFSLMLGTVGFFSSAHFVKEIYRAIKTD
eukprot:snap_masked-scaffold_34-processed-gene-1.27-mRNA-1 protein AED:0.01 eAED:0.01 QI:0/-1/0/1/-1/1/1/0/594